MFQAKGHGRSKCNACVGAGRRRGGEGRGEEEGRDGCTALALCVLPQVDDARNCLEGRVFYEAMTPDDKTVIRNLLLEFY